MSDVAQLPAKRKGNPAWIKGGPSPTPSGRSARNDRWIADLCRPHTKEGVEKLVKIMRNPKARDGDVIKAVSLLFDRAWGTAPLNLSDSTADTLIQIVKSMGDGTPDEIIDVTPNRAG